MMKIRRTDRLPLVYSCSGCSSAAQMANYIALRLDREGMAEMSCIAGIGGDVPHLVAIATSGRPILALDGCPLQCAKACTRQRGIEPDEHVALSEHGVKKRYHAEFDRTEADALVARLRPVAARLGTKPDSRRTGLDKAEAAWPG
jgi:uncharacterized metal-binding protein